MDRRENFDPHVFDTLIERRRRGRFLIFAIHLKHVRNMRAG